LGKRAAHRISPGARNLEDRLSTAPVISRSCGFHMIRCTRLRFVNRNSVLAGPGQRPFTQLQLPFEFHPADSRISAKNPRCKLEIVFLCIIALVTACSMSANQANGRNATSSAQDPMTTDNNRTKDEAAIRELIDGFLKAIRAKDIHGVMSVFAPEVVSFDLGPPLQHGGARHS
jgi:hypothetical protein